MKWTINWITIYWKRTRDLNWKCRMNVHCCKMNSHWFNLSTHQGKTNGRQCKMKLWINTRWCVDYQYRCIDISAQWQCGRRKRPTQLGLDLSAETHKMIWSTDNQFNPRQFCLLTIDQESSVNQIYQVKII